VGGIEPFGRRLQFVLAVIDDRSDAGVTELMDREHRQPGVEYRINPRIAELGADDAYVRRAGSARASLARSRKSSTACTIGSMSTMGPRVFRVA
jgi:hypothetical protein